MYGFYYVYRGPKNTLFARYGAALFITNEVNEDKYEPYVPGVGHLFDRKVDISITTDPSSHLFTREIDFNDINSVGELAVKRAEKYLYSYGLAYAGHTANLYIKTVSKPGPWYERLAVYAAIQTRRQYMNSLGAQWEIDLYTLERSTELQIKYLSCLKLLPPEVDWMKVMNAFKDVYPKPAWWYQELRYYKLRTEGKLWR